MTIVTRTAFPKLIWYSLHYDAYADMWTALNIIPRCGLALNLASRPDL